MHPDQEPQGYNSEEEAKGRWRPDPINTHMATPGQEEEPSPWDHEDPDDGSEMSIASALFSLDESKRMEQPLEQPVAGLAEFETQRLNGKLMMKTRRDQHCTKLSRHGGLA